MTKTHNPNIHDDFKNSYIRKMHCESISKPPISIVIEVFVLFFFGRCFVLFGPTFTFMDRTIFFTQVMWKTKAKWNVARLHGVKSKSNISSFLHVMHVLVMHSYWRKKSTHPLVVVHYWKKKGKTNLHSPPPLRKKDEPCKVHV